jgi:hypothetical protein
MGSPPRPTPWATVPLYNEACEYLDHAASMFSLPKLSVFAELDLKQREIEEPSKVEIRGYVPMFSSLGEKLNLVRFYDPSQFGGTLTPL